MKTHHVMVTYYANLCDATYDVFPISTFIYS